MLEHHFTPQFYVDLEGSVGGLNWSNQGGGCYIYGFGCGVGQAVQGGLSPRATTWLIGADLGWNPVTNLNFDLELMYQSTNQTKPSGFLGTVYNNGGVGGASSPGRLGRQLERLRRPSPHHPLLLIATRSVGTPNPGAKAPGFFVTRPPLIRNAAARARSRHGPDIERGAASPNGGARRRGLTTRDPPRAGRWTARSAAARGAASRTGPLRRERSNPLRRRGPATGPRSAPARLANTGRTTSDIPEAPERNARPAVACQATSGTAPLATRRETPAGGQIGGRLRSVASTATGFCGRPESQAFSRERPSRRRFPPGCGPGRARPLRPPPAAGAADHAIDVSDIAAAVGPDCVTIMQRRSSNYVHGAESDAKFIDRPAGHGYVSDVSGRFPVAEGSQRQSQRQTQRPRKHREEGADQLRFRSSRERAGGTGEWKEPTPKRYQLEVTHDAHQEHFARFGRRRSSQSPARRLPIFPRRRPLPSRNMSRSATSAASPAGPCRAPTPA